MYAFLDGSGRLAYLLTSNEAKNHIECTQPDLRSFTVESLAELATFMALVSGNKPNWSKTNESRNGL